MGYIVSGVKGYVVFVAAGNCVSTIALIGHWNVLCTWMVHTTSGKSHNETLLWFRSRREALCCRRRRHCCRHLQWLAWLPHVGRHWLVWEFRGLLNDWIVVMTGRRRRVECGRRQAVFKEHHIQQVFTLWRDRCYNIHIIHYHYHISHLITSL